MSNRNGLWVRCGRCDWVWVAYAPLPAPLDVVAKAAKHAECPNCNSGAADVFLAKEADIVAALAKAAAV